MSKYYLGIDLGGTEIKIAVVDDKGAIIEEGRVPNSIDAAPKTICDAIIETAREMKNFKKLKGTGIGVAGDIDQEKGMVRFSPNLPKWKNVNLRSIFAKTLPCPIIVDNDANVAAVGAYWLDAKGKAKNLVCITLGTGVGGGIMLDGKIYRGATGTAGEIGHMTLEPEGPLCKCGNRGCIERYLGAGYLSMEARAEIENGKKGNIITKIVGGNMTLVTPKVLAEAANAGDALAKQIWLGAGRRLGIVLASIINMLNPEMIVLSGGVSKAGGLLLAPIRETVDERAFKTPAKACKIVVSKHTERLGVCGAALLAKKD